LDKGIRPVLLKKRRSIVREFPHNPREAIGMRMLAEMKKDRFGQN
jgi:hypothetical protein